MREIKWTKIKPKRFKEDCLLLTATFLFSVWHYDLFEIKRTEGDDEAGWYWGIFAHGEEWGDYADLAANKYCLFPALKNKKLNTNKENEGV